jgi:colanic acid/amylovoran biosynthesis glycosyltransferase
LRFARHLARELWLVKRLAPPDSPVKLSVVRSQPIRIAYLFTTFPQPTETFLQREVQAMIGQGFEIELYSLFGGGGMFADRAVTKLSMWRLVELIWIIPWLAVTRWDVFGVLWRGLWSRRAPGWLNFWENMLGAGFAGVFYPHFRRNPPDWIHAAWSGAPATAAWILNRLNGQPYSAAAHAYDIYENGGDWWLREKLADARFVHTSTAMGQRSLIEKGVEAEKIHVIRRGMQNFPKCRPLRPNRDVLNLVCIARLVAKKGLSLQLKIYEALQARGIPFNASIIGEGPERSKLEQQITTLGLGKEVKLTGHLDQAAVWEHLAQADALLHTGVVAPSGDRDGLPNVIPEAMIAGVLVFTTPAAATTEAITDRDTGWVIPVSQPDVWADRISDLQGADNELDSVRRAARAWVEQNYDGARNAECLAALFRGAVTK